MKHRSLGAGKINGPGGKVKSGENLENAVIREVFEETGYNIANPRHVGVLEFVWPESKIDNNQQCHIYTCTEYTGNIVKCDECTPKWYKIEEIPNLLSKMWDDDQYWLIDVLSGGRADKRIFFNEDSKVSRVENI